jgi:hypothetical protein
VTLTLIAGCKFNPYDGALEKAKASFDKEAATIFANTLERQIEFGKIKKFDFKSNQELTKDSFYGKVIEDYGTEIKKPKVKDTYKFFVTVTKDYKITIKVGETSTTAVQLYPKPEKYEAPYDVLN